MNFNVGFVGVKALFNFFVELNFLHKTLGIGKSVQDKMQGLEARPLGSYGSESEGLGAGKAILRNGQI